MSIGRTLFASALAASAVPAVAAVTVIGSTSARMCFEAADSHLTPSQATLDDCDEALQQGNMSKYDTVATYVNRGILRLRAGRDDDAMADFDRALAQDPNQAEAYLNKGMALLRRDDAWQDAMAQFDTALAKKTRRPALAYYGRAVANELGGRVKEAYFDYREASRIEPKWRQPQIDLARFTVHQHQAQ
jgi:tetratricopeptide (TPR) repeat protein